MEWICQDGKGCKHSNRVRNLRVDIVQTAIAILRDFNLNAIKSARAFDGLESAVTIAIDLSPIHERVNDTYIRDMKIDGLKALRLAKCEHITDATLAYLGNSAIRNTLAFLDVRKCHNISVDAVENLKTKCPLLVYVEQDSRRDNVKSFVAATIGGDRKTATAASKNFQKNLMNQTKNFVPSALKSRFFGGGS